MILYLVILFLINIRFSDVVMDNLANIFNRSNAPWLVSFRLEGKKDILDKFKFKVTFVKELNNLELENWGNKNHLEGLHSRCSIYRRKNPQYFCDAMFQEGWDELKGKRKNSKKLKSHAERVDLFTEFSFTNGAIPEEQAKMLYDLTPFINKDLYCPNKTIAMEDKAQSSATYEELSTESFASLNAKTWLNDGIIHSWLIW